MSTTLTILAILIVSFCTCQGECPIECFCDQTTICSGDKILTRLPQIPNWNGSAGSVGGGQFQIPITRLELSHFLFQHLDKNSLLQLISNLTEFRLTNNAHLISIDNDTFTWPNDSVGGSTSSDSARGNGSESVEILHSYQSKSSRENNNSSSSTSVSISLNPTSSTPIPTDDSGQKIPTHLILNLRMLDLSGNSLKYFVAGSKLARLRILDLSSNRLQQVHKLDHLHALESVNLRDNQILFLQGTLFQNLDNLQYINLDWNKIGHLNPTTFSNLPSLAHLILSSNPIQNLLPGFVWNSRVQFVDVSRVGLHQIPTSLTTSVRDFRAAHNHLTIIRDSDFESYPNVRLLVLDENSIETVVDDAFGRLDFLSRLWINGNRLSKVPQNLPPSLESLQLENNIIVNISGIDFKNLKLLSELNLARNKITQLPTSTFSDLINLRHLNLGSNLLDTIEKDSLINLTKLETLDISHNPIKVIVNGVFNHVPALSILQMSGLSEPNPEFDTKSFHSLVNLEILHLKDSPYFTQKMIVREPVLKYFISLVELDVRGCQLCDLNLVSSVIINSPLFESLHSIKLGENPWICPDGTRAKSKSNPNTSDDEYQDFMQLYYKNIIRDTDKMICFNSSKNVTVLNIALKSIPKTITIKTKRNQHQLQRSSQTQNNYLSSLFSNLTASTSPVKSLITSPKPTERTTLSTSTTLTTMTSRLLYSISPIQEKPTRSYFEDHTLRPRGAVRTLVDSGAGRELPASSSGGRTEKKSLSIRYKADVESRPDPDSLYKEKHGQQYNKVSSLHTTTTEHIDGGGSMRRKNENNLEQPHEAPMTNNNNYNNKTNNDNAIIDEERNPKSSKKEKKEEELQRRKMMMMKEPGLGETVVRVGSIDGFSENRFPAFSQHEDSLSNNNKNDDPHHHTLSSSSPPPPSSTSFTSSHSQNFHQPKSSYLKSLHLEMGRGFENEPLSPASNGNLIIKTLIVSALVCLLSILFLLLLSLAICRFSFSSWRSKTNPFPIGIHRRRRKWDTMEICDEEENIVAVSDSESTLYQTCTWDPYIHRGPTEMSYSRLGDQDMIELGGIPNRLYFENEEIYHIS